MKDKAVIIANLTKLKAKLPELTKLTKQDKFWDGFHPYTIEEAIEYIAQKPVEGDECGCGCHTSASSDANMKFNGCDVCKIEHEIEKLPNQLIEEINIVRADGAYISGGHHRQLQDKLNEVIKALNKKS